jgi:hypothetical protein
MIEGFDVKEQVLGTGDQSVYTFEFKIFDKTDLLIYVQDASGDIVQEVRGDDTTFLASVTFDSIKGGGSVGLLADLTDEYVMTMFLAPDAPDQPASFPNKKSFTLPDIEGALDFLATLIQRVAWLSQRSVKMHDLDDIDFFDPTLPPNPAGNPGAVLAVKEDGTGFEWRII